MIDAQTRADQEAAEEAARLQLAVAALDERRCQLAALDARGDAPVVIDRRHLQNLLRAADALQLLWSLVVEGRVSDPAAIADTLPLTWRRPTAAEIADGVPADDEMVELDAELEAAAAAAAAALGFVVPALEMATA